MQIYIKRREEVIKTMSQISKNLPFPPPPTQSKFCSYASALYLAIIIHYSLPNSLGILNAVNAIVQGLASAIVVEYFCVSGNLKPVESVCVGCKAKMTLLGETVQWDGKIFMEEFH